MSNRQWTTPFDPVYSSYEGSDYTEGNDLTRSFIIHDEIMSGGTLEFKMS